MSKHESKVPSDLATFCFDAASLQVENIKTPTIRTDAVNLFQKI
jgi:hypothetical protein